MITIIKFIVDLLNWAILFFQTWRKSTKGHLDPSVVNLVGLIFVTMPKEDLCKDSIKNKLLMLHFQVGYITVLNNYWYMYKRIPAPKIEQTPEVLEMINRNVMIKYIENAKQVGIPDFIIQMTDKWVQEYFEVAINEVRNILMSPLYPAKLKPFITSQIMYMTLRLMWASAKRKFFDFNGKFEDCLLRWMEKNEDKFNELMRYDVSKLLEEDIQI